MAIIDDILTKLGLKYEDLTSAERDTLSQWIQALDSNQLTLPRVKDYIALLRDQVEDEIVQVANGTKQDLFLKARLRNLKLIEAFLSTPEKAREALDRAIAGIVSNRGGEKGNE